MQPPVLVSNNNKKNVSDGSTINFALSGNKFVFQNNKWHDVTDIKEYEGRIHPTIAENISLKKRVELLVDLVAKSQFEANEISKDLEEATEIYEALKRQAEFDDQPSPDKEKNDENVPN